MFISSLVLLQAFAVAVPWSASKPRNDEPESAAVVDALADPELYERLTRYQPEYYNEQSLFGDIFRTEKSDSCGAHAGCPAWDGEVRKINGRDYHLYCQNAPWGSYFWLPASDSLEECERRCHENRYDCNGLTYYPSTRACSIITSQNAAPYIWDNGYQKFGAIPVSSKVGFGPGDLCPLPGSDNQVYDFKDKKYRFKMSCRNQFKVDNRARRQLGTVNNVDECGELCGAAKDCYGFHYYQPTFPGGRADGMRSCELITTKIKNGDWVPIHRPNQYLSGLRVENADCGDLGWNQDERGKKKDDYNDSDKDEQTEM